MSKAKGQNADLENLETYHDCISVEAVGVILRALFARKRYGVIEDTHKMAVFFNRNDDYVYDFRDEVYVVDLLTSLESVRIWVKQSEDSVVVEFSHVIEYDSGLFPVIDSKGRHRVKQSLADIGYFNVTSLESVVNDFEAMVNDGPYSSEKTVDPDNEAFYQYGNIYRAKNLDGVKILQNPKGLKEAHLIVNGLDKQWQKEDAKRHE